MIRCFLRFLNIIRVSVILWLVCSLNSCGRNGIPVEIEDNIYEFTLDSLIFHHSNLNYCSDLNFRFMPFYDSPDLVSNVMNKIATNENAILNFENYDLSFSGFEIVQITNSLKAKMKNKYFNAKSNRNSPCTFYVSPFFVMNSGNSVLLYIYHADIDNSSLIISSKNLITNVWDCPVILLNSPNNFNDMTRPRQPQAQPTKKHK